MRVRLIHGNRDESGQGAEELRQSGFEVDFEPFGTEIPKRTGGDPPAAITD